MADTFRLARSAFIKAPPATVHALVNDFHQWEQWSPWVKMDAGHLNQTYEGPPSGVGAGYTWSGPKTGKGRMEILTSTPAHIGVSLDFIAPMRRSNKADFTFTPEDGGTKVEWAMTGPMGLFDKIMQIFFSMEKMVGPSFEQGLAGIKTLAESAAPKSAPAPQPKPAPAAAAPKPVAPKATPAKPVVPKAPAKPKAAAAPKAAAKSAAAPKPQAVAKPTPPKAKPTIKATAVKAKPVAAKPAAKPAAKAAPAKAAASKTKAVAAPEAPAAKAVAKPAPKPAAAKKPAAKAKPAAKPKAPTTKA